MSTPDLPPLVHSLSHLLLTRGWMLATAESCTGGGVAAACTDLAGSSAWFAGGVVSYSNAAKTRLLAVPTQVLEEHGAVSEAVVRLMAQGVLAPLQAQVGVAISGIAGPGGGTPTKPVGTVWLGWSWAQPNGVVLTEAECLHLPGDRTDVRHAAVAHALQGLLLRVPRWAGESGPI